MHNGCRESAAQRDRTSCGVKVSLWVASTVSGRQRRRETPPRYSHGNRDPKMDIRRKSLAHVQGNVSHMRGGIHDILLA